VAAFALADCNNFYVSCERVFRPDLVGRPVVVLSNNDGCCVARSNEAKKLGVKMAQPAFQVRHLVESHGLVMLSSNYTLYGDMSARVMAILGEHVPATEVYSIDECFMDIDGLGCVGDLDAWARGVRETVRRSTGIPVSIGLAGTKTLAKLANRLAKNSARADGVLDLLTGRRFLPEALRQTPVGEVWGIGPALADRCRHKGVVTALDLAEADDEWVKKTLGMIGLRTAMELRGAAVHDFDSSPEPRQSCCCSRTLAEATVDREAVHAAVVEFAATAAAKIRAEGLACGVVQTFLGTDRFRREAPQRTAAVSCKLDWPANATPDIVRAATAALGRAWADGFAWRKVGVMLMDLCDPTAAPRDLFAPKPSPRAEALMGTLDGVNARFGRRTLRFGLTAETPAWQPKSDSRTPNWTTDWDDIPVARAV
jgi:DNA polymerase V